MRRNPKGPQMSVSTTAETTADVLDVPAYLRPASPMDAQKKWEIHHECERLLSLLLYYNDHGLASKGADLFTEDGTVKVRGMGVWEGRDSIRKSQRARETHTREGTLTVHQIHGLLLGSISKTEAVGTAYFTLYKSIGKPGQGIPGQGYVAKLERPMLVGETRTRFVNTRSGWKIAEHEIIYVFDNDPSLERRQAAYAEMKKHATHGTAK